MLIHQREANEQHFVFIRWLDHLGSCIGAVWWNCQNWRLNRLSNGLLCQFFEFWNKTDKMFEMNVSSYISRRRGEESFETISWKGATLVSACSTSFFSTPGVCTASALQKCVHWTSNRLPSWWMTVNVVAPEIWHDKPAINVGPDMVLACIKWYYLCLRISSRWRSLLCPNRNLCRLSGIQRLGNVRGLSAMPFAVRIIRRQM